MVGKNFKRLQRRGREARMIARAMKSARHPLLAHLVPIRRCNLSCTYCNEYDSISKPVPLDQIRERIDHLARLNTAAVHLSGGEPLLHPNIIDIVAYISDHGMFSGLLTNGYLLTKDVIRQLNQARLDYLQISVDNLTPDSTSKKSLKVLDQKLQWLADLAEFDVSLNSVVGSSIQNPKDAVEVTKRAISLNFKTSVGVIHDGSGQLQPLKEDQRAAVSEIFQRQKKTFMSFNYYTAFQKNLMNGQPNDWHCGAGSRYLYICEDGLVHYCSQQRGYPAIPLSQYGQADLEREYEAVKSCAPFCTISCVHRIAVVDQFREKPLEALARFFPGGSEGPSMPAPVRFLKWLFLAPAQTRGRRVLRRTAMKMLGVDS